MYFKGDPYLGENDPGENAQSSLEIDPVVHSDPDELKARGLTGRDSFLTVEFDIVVETTASRA
jgi:catechol 1,2-dioxygenase